MQLVAIPSSNLIVTTNQCACADDEGSSGDEGALRGGETFAGPQAGRGMGSKVKAAALEMLEGGCSGLSWAVGLVGGGCWMTRRVMLGHGFTVPKHA